ncbi:MAG: hypothetical protein ACK4J0_01660 [Candidatus Anstonellaceae archaeon]
MISQNIESEENLKISSLAFEPICTKFWEKDWVSIYILKYNPDFFKKILKNESNYLLELAITPASARLHFWKTGTKEKFEINSQLQEKFSTEKQKLLQAHTYAYDANLSFNRLLDILERFLERNSALDRFISWLTNDNEEVFAFVKNNRFDIVAFGLIPGGLLTNFLLNTFTDIVEDNDNLTAFSSSWKESMNAFSNSLDTCAQATNKIFLETEKKAILLYRQGIESEGYFGSPKEIYNQWKNFVKGAKYYSNPTNLLPSNPSGSKSSLYGLAYRSALNIKNTCSYPGDLPIFDWPTPDLFFNAACTLEENSLLSYALEMDKQLQTAYLELQEEHSKIEKFSEELKQNFSLKRKELDLNKPDLFFSDEIFDISLNTIKVSNVSGSIQELYSTMKEYSLVAEEYFKEAKSNRQLVVSMLFYKNSSENYLKSLEAIEQMNFLMEQKTNTACTYAKRELDLLSKEIKKASESKENAKLVDLVSTYNSNNKIFEKAQNSNKLGEKFNLCKEAYLSLINFPSTLNKTQNNALARSLLKKFLEYIKSGEKIGADVSEYRRTYENMDKLIEQNYLVDVLDIEANIKSIKNYLNSFMQEETDLYIQISSILEKTPTINKALYSSFNLKMKEYRDNEGWNLVAFKNKNSLNSFLKSTLKQLNKNLVEYLEKTLCNQAKFYPIQISLPKVDTTLNIGGRWEGINPLGINFDDSLELSCTLPIPFSNSAIKAKSENIEKIILSGSSMKLSLNSLDAYQTLFVNFSEEKKPFSLSSEKCLLTITKENNILFSANYTIKALYNSEAVSFERPWDKSLDKIDAKIFAQEGGAYNGRLKLTQSLEPMIEFTLPLKNEINNFFASISSSLKRDFQTSQETLLSSNNSSFLYSYKLNLGKLPACNNIYVEREEKAKNIKNLKINAIGGTVKKLEVYPLQTSSLWKANITKTTTTNLELIISFNFVDIEQWFNQTYNELYIQARDSSDDYSLGLLEKAKNAFGLSDYGTASRILNQVKSRIISLQINKEEYSIFSEKLKQAKEMLSKLSSISVSDSKKSIKLKSFINFLSSSIEEATKLSNSDVQKASERLEKDLNKLNIDVEKEINSLYSQLQQRGDEFILLSSKTNLSVEGLNTALDSLLKAKELLIENNFIDALAEVYKASDLLDKIQNSAWLSEGIFEELSNKKIQLEKNIETLIEKLEVYLKGAKAIENSKLLYKPPLSSTEAKNIQKPLNSIFKNWVEPKNLSPSTPTPKILQMVVKNQEILAQASKTYNNTEKKYLDAKNSLQAKASALLNNAKSILDSLEDNTRKEELTKEINKAEELIVKEDYASAILLLDKLIKNYSSSSSSQAQSSSLPLLEIFVSIVFVAAIVYILFQSKNKPKKPEQKEIKSLKKV